MDNPLSNLKIEAWFHVAIILGAIFLGISLTVELKIIGNAIAQLLSLGVLLIGLGEWSSHPYDTTSREWRLSGIFFDFIGVIILGIGLYYLLR